LFKDKNKKVQTKGLVALSSDRVASSISFMLLLLLLLLLFFLSKATFTLYA